MTRFVSLLLLLCACAHAPAPVTAPASAPAVADAARPPLGRLPATVVPTKYELSLRILPSEAKFSGHARISVQLAEPVQSFFLHGRGLTVTNATFELANGLRIPAEYKEVHEDGVARVSLAQVAPAGAAIVELDWIAPFGEQAQGLFRVAEGGRDYAFTQFEPLFARRAFPCFDEPAFKTPFDISVTVPAENEAISNTLPVETTRDGQLKTVRFGRTLPLPTYLVMLAVGPLDVVSAPDLPPTAIRPRPLPVRAAATKGQGPKLAYALSHVGPIVEALEKELGPFPYPKLDLVAVPGFAAGAMENAGAVTFREWLLLIDDAHHGVDQARAFRAVTAHELAHQWFGDLVTLAWWDDLWLNEAFATWMESHVVAALDPGAHEEEEALDAMHEAMGADSRASSRRVRQEIASHHDVDNAFDPITYRKGAGVISMFERWVGRARFFAGIHRYLERFANRSATAADFVAAISEEAGLDVAGPFRTFLDQPGVPLVTAKVSAHSPFTLTLSQQRWLPIASPAPNDGEWQIPICVRYGGNGTAAEKCTLLSKHESTLTFDGAEPEWILPNAEGAGYFRFSLDEAQWLALAKNRPALSAREQLAAADSLRAAFEAGALEAKVFYGSLAPLAASGERHVAQIPFAALHEARDVIVPEHAALVEAHARKLYAGVLRRATIDGPQGESDEARLQRAELVDFLLDVAREPALRTEAKTRGEKLVGFGGDGAVHADAVDATLADAVLAVAVAEDGAPLVKALGELLAKTNDPDVRRRVLAALGAAKGEAAETARALVLTDSVRGNEMYYLLRRQFTRPTTRESAWKWLVANYDAVVRKYPEEFVGLLPWYGAGFCSDEDARTVEAFFQPRIEQLPGGPRNLAATLEAIHLCAARVARHKASAASFFSEK